MRRFAPLLAALLLVVAACTTAAPTATPGPTLPAVPAATATPTEPPPTPTAPPSEPPATPTEAATPSEAPAATPGPTPPVVEMGTGLQVATSSGGRVTVGVVEFYKATACGSATPPDGDVFVVASVGYSADSGSVSVAPTDWIVVDSQHRMAAANPLVTCQKGTFGKTTLAQGQDIGGWLTFAVAADATHLDLAYWPAGGPRALWHLW